MVSTHVLSDLSSGAVVNLRPGSFPPEENTAAGGRVVDKSPDAAI